MHNDWSDGDLLELYANNGDERAFEEVVERHRRLVFRVCRRVTGSNADAEDAVQQVFVVLADKAESLTSRESLAGWLHRTAWQVSFRYVRATTIRRRHENAVGDDIHAIATIAAREVGASEQAVELHRAIARLPEGYREALVLHHLEGYSVAESATRMKCPVGTVAARLSRGREMLRQQLSAKNFVLSILVVETLLMAEAHHIQAAARRPLPNKGGRPPARPAPVPLAAAPAAVLIGAGSAAWVRPVVRSAAHATWASRPVWMGLGVWCVIASGAAAAVFAPMVINSLDSSSGSTVPSKSEDKPTDRSANLSHQSQAEASPASAAGPGAASVPEPGAMPLVVAIGYVLGLRRRR